MSQDTDTIKAKKLINELNLIKESELITVKAISPKIAEQLPDLTEEGVTRVEIIGAIPPYGMLVVRDERGRLGTMGSLPFIMHLEDKGASNSEAHETLKRLPQIFKA